MITQRLDAAIKEVCPINGVSIGRPDDKATWRIDFAQSATAQQRADAAAVVEAFDPNAEPPPETPPPDVKKLADLLVVKNVITTEDAATLYQPGLQQRG